MMMYYKSSIREIFTVALTNLFSESDNAALTQEQSCFGPLHGSSEHHIALRGLGMVHDLTT